MSSSIWVTGLLKMIKFLLDIKVSSSWILLTPLTHLHHFSTLLFHIQLISFEYFALSLSLLTCRLPSESLLDGRVELKLHLTGTFDYFKIDDSLLVATGFFKIRNIII